MLVCDVTGGEEADPEGEKCRYDLLCEAYWLSDKLLIIAKLSEKAFEITVI
jgi:hypothetical protein